MAKKGFTPEQIINKLREAELLLQQGATIATVSKSIGVSTHLLPLVKRVWWLESRPGKETQDSREGKRPVKETGGRPEPG